MRLMIHANKTKEEKAEMKKWDVLEKMNAVLRSLDFSKRKVDCGWEIVTDTGYVIGGYDDDKSAENMYHFLCGIRYQQLRKGGAA